MSEPSTTERAVERKLRVHALFRMPDLVGLVPGLAGSTVDTGIARVDRRPAVQVRAVYHDTEDLRLIRWGVTLCRRAGGTDEGWHLTMPAEGSATSVDDEMRVPLGAGEPGQVPAEMSDVVTALARRNPLRPVATLHTQRTALVLFDTDDRQVAELVDDVVSIMDGDVVAGRFRELQIRSLGADAGALDPVIDLLLAHGGDARHLLERRQRTGSGREGRSGRRRALRGRPRRSRR